MDADAGTQTADLFHFGNWKAPAAVRPRFRGIRLPSGSAAAGARRDWDGVAAKSRPPTSRPDSCRQERGSLQREHHASWNIPDMIGSPTAIP